MNERAGEDIPERPVRIAVDRVILEGDLAIPPEAKGIVVFVHGSGSSRFSSRNRYVARYLQRDGLSTLLFDLLTRQEEEIDNYTRELRFDIGLLAGRLSGVTQWLASQEETRNLAVGYFGASTGAAAALIAETRNPAAVKAIVSRGGRPDLAGQALGRVQAPDVAHRRRRRPSGYRPQRAGPGAAERNEADGHRPRCDPPL